MGNKKMSANTERLYAYAKGGGLNGFRNGGGVLDKKQLGGFLKSAAKNIKKITRGIVNENNNAALNVLLKSPKGTKLPVTDQTLKGFLNQDLPKKPKVKKKK